MQQAGTGASQNLCFSKCAQQLHKGPRDVCMCMCVCVCVCVYFRVIKPRRMRWAGHVAHWGERRGGYRVFVGKPEGKRPLGRPRHIWEDNIKMHLQEVGCEIMDWIELAEDRDRCWALVNAVLNLRVP